MNSEPIDSVAVLDFGGQYAHLIANRIRRLGVFTRIFSPNTPVHNLSGVSGIIFSGGPMSVYSEDAPDFNHEILKLNKPILGICYGHQLVAQCLGGVVSPGKIKEYGIADLRVLGGNSEHGLKTNALFKKIPSVSKAWMSHGDTVSKLPIGFKTIASTDDCEFAAVANEERKIYGIQFHPEVTHSEFGIQLLDNFINICECKQNWNIKSYLPQISEKILEQVGEHKVFLLVSGGVDSTVAFVLLNRVLGHERVLGLHIDNGMMRKDESKSVMDFLTEHGMGNLQIANASEDFLNELENITEPEQKRKIIGDTFLWVKDREMLRLSLDTDKWIIAQGTIYPDTIESGGTKNADLIKTHHNRVPAVLELLEKGLLLEPLADLYKDEVRILGEELGIPHNLIWRHPFPGPGLGVRLLCSDGKSDTAVISEELPQTLSHKITSSSEPTTNDFSALETALAELGLKGQVLPIKSVGVQGDARTYAHPFLIESDLGWDDLEKHSTAIVNRYKEINRAVWKVGSVKGNIVTSEELHQTLSHRTRSSSETTANHLNLHKNTVRPCRLVGSDDLLTSSSKPTIVSVAQYCTKENFDTLRIFDEICNNFLVKNNLYSQIWQMPVVMLPLRISEKPCVVIRPVNSAEAMTANFAKIPQELLKGELWIELEKAGAGALFYDITHKPPATIEWE